MRNSRRYAWTLMFVPFVLVACGSADTAEEAETAAEETPVTETAPVSFMAQVMPMNESGVSGQAELKAVGESTELRVVLTGAMEGELMGHIHAGTCEAPGAVVVPLTSITVDATGNGEATSTVAVPLMTVMNGSHIVVYHEAGGSPGAPRACAAIPAHTM